MCCIPFKNQIFNLAKTPDGFFELSKKYDLPLLLNTDLSVPKIGLMEQDHWQEIWQMLIGMQVKQRRRHAGLACIEEFKKQ
ncbi:hypothetical protein [Microscilla marina]|uniref:Uncharacterized protein n=1 Tax=Microscilla marina ATCC 23134 TaxID=313606 RepID=A1ZTI4_MICM2|nr:hypothetical protein [Microscilla marina]EAY26244.1 hypothetical protein M23134_01566 [Microscilla marina ATCC 23134]